MRGFRALVVVPMLGAGAVGGLIGISRTRAGGFTPAEIALVETFADQAVIAIENARLFEELEQRNARPDRGAGAADGHRRDPARDRLSPTDLQPVLDSDRRERGAPLRGAVRRHLRCDGRRIALVGRDGPMAPAAAASRWTALVRGTHRRGRAALERRTIHVRRPADRPSTTFPTGSATATARRPPDDARRAAAPRGRGRSASISRRVAPRSRPFTRAADRAAGDVRRPGGHRHRERPPVRGAGGAQRRAHEALEQQTATGEILRSSAARRPICSRCSTRWSRERAARLCGAEGAIICRFDGEHAPARSQHGAPPGVPRRSGEQPRSGRTRRAVRASRTRAADRPHPRRAGRSASGTRSRGSSAAAGIRYRAWPSRCCARAS